MVTFSPKAAAAAEVASTATDTKYEERDDNTDTHGMRFARDTVISFGRHEAFRVNRHGVPVFSPGWTATRSAFRAWMRVVLLLVAAAAMFASSAWMIQIQVGTDPEYHRILETGISTEATITSVTEGKNPAGIPANVYEADWAGGGETGTAVIDTTTNPLASGKIYYKGDTIPIIVDSADTTNWIFAENKPLLGKINVVNTMPILLGAGLAVASLVATWLAGRLTELAIRTRIDRRRAAAAAGEVQDPATV
ncbi:hypothetical protein LG293_16395 (plasmid) [Citricoccus nitrophenolicus]